MAHIHAGSEDYVVQLITFEVFLQVPLKGCVHKLTIWRSCTRKSMLQPEIAFVKKHKPYGSLAIPEML